MKQAFLLIPAIVIGLSTTACASHYGYYGGYYAPMAPPAPRYEVMGIAPGPGYVWTNGYWAYRGRGYDWVAGSWRRPPRAHARWEAGRWEHGDRGYRWREGHWR